MTKYIDSKRRKTLLASATLGAAAAAPVVVPSAAESRPREGMPRANSAVEKQVLAALDEVDRDHRYLNVPQADGRLLRVLAESLSAKLVVEIGTSTGYSGLWILLGLAKTGGRLVTIEIDPGRHEMARRSFAKAGVLSQATLVLGDAHHETTKLHDPIDLVFIDADKDGYHDYLRKLRPLVRPGGLIVAHNMHSPPPDPLYVEAVTTDPALETVFLNMHEAGVGITLKKR